MLRRFLFFAAVAFLAAIPMVVFAQKNNDVHRFISTLFPSPIPNVFMIKGIGVIGDSQSDEYQADDARGYQYAPTTLNWVEQLVKNRNLNFGSWNTWGDARRTGFAYNWAQSGATSETVLSMGQHTGLAQQVHEGSVNIAIIYIGANDFFPTGSAYQSLYHNTLSHEDTATMLTVITSNIETAATTIQKNGNVKVIVITVPDWNLQNASRIAFPNDEGRQRVSAAIHSINDRLRIFTLKQGMYLVDSNTFYRTQLADAPLGSISVGSEMINILIPGDEPHHAFLSDGIHPGTVINGLFARFLLEQINKSIGTNITPLTDEEILGNAGI